MYRSAVRPTRAGTPATTVPGGTSLLTTAPAATIDLVADRDTREKDGVHADEHARPDGDPAETPRPRYSLRNTHVPASCVMNETLGAISVSSPIEMRYGSEPIDVVWMRQPCPRSLRAL